MKKQILNLCLSLLVGISLNSCGGSEEPKTTVNNTKKDTLTVKNEITEPEEKPVVSLTEKEAEKRMKTFLKENSKKYKDYGEFQDMDLVGGNYTKDGALDYFYNVNFYPGGDYVYTTHFFYESDQDKIRELSINKASDFMKNIDVKKITEGKLIGSANLWNAFSGEHSASRSVNAEFTIEGNKIYFDPKYLPKFKKAEKEISSELDQKQKELEEQSINNEEYN
jgi:hypothetical protein